MTTSKQHSYYSDNPYEVWNASAYKKNEHTTRIKYLFCNSKGGVPVLSQPAPHAAISPSHAVSPVAFAQSGAVHNSYSSSNSCSLLYPSYAEPSLHAD